MGTLFSMPWDYGTGGDADEYVAAKWHETYQYLFRSGGADFPNVGPLPGILNEFAASVGTNQVLVGTGAALVNGCLVTHVGGATAVNVPSASAGHTRLDRVVLRLSYASQIATIERLANAQEDSGTPPALTQGATYWEIPLYQALVNSAGAVTLTNERKFLGSGDALPDGVITTDKLADGAVNTAKIANNAVTTAKLVSRTRRFLVPVYIGPNDSYSTYGVLMDGNSGITTVMSGFMVPEDFLDQLTITPVVRTSGLSGDVTARMEARFGMMMDHIDANLVYEPVDGSWWNYSVNAEEYCDLMTMSLQYYVSTGYFVTVTLSRDGGDAYDTAGDIYLIGFMVEYLADS